MENTYDNNGYVISTKDWNGVETQYQRDRFGRVTQETIGIQNGNASNAYIKKYSYLGETSLITQIQILDGSNRLIREETYSYYAANEPAKNRLKSFSICYQNSCRTEQYSLPSMPIRCWQRWPSLKMERSAVICMTQLEI